MGRKIPFLISTLMCIPTLFGTVNVFADDTGSEELLRYWTVEQLIDLKDELTATKNLRCSGDAACEREFDEEIRMSDEIKYNLLDTFENFRLTITRINPSAETIHVVYHDTDAMMSRFGKAERQILSEFHLVWLDPSLPDPRTDFTWVGHPQFVDQIHDGALADGVHLLLTKSIERDGQDFITPNREVAYQTNAGELPLNTTGTLHYAGLIGTWQPYGAFEYGECLASPDYRPGMECRYVFYEDFSRGYLPFATTTETDPASIPEIKSSEVVATSETASIATAPTPVTSTSIMRVPVYVPQYIASTTSKQKTDDSQTTTEAENTVTETTENLVTDASEDYVEVPLAANKQESEFPWWLIVFAVSGLVIVTFWAMLIRSKTNED